LLALLHGAGWALEGCARMGLALMQHHPHALVKPAPQRAPSPAQQNCLQGSPWRWSGSSHSRCRRSSSTTVRPASGPSPARTSTRPCCFHSLRNPCLALHPRTLFAPLTPVVPSHDPFPCERLLPHNLDLVNTSQSLVRLQPAEMRWSCGVGGPPPIWPCAWCPCSASRCSRHPQAVPAAPATPPICPTPGIRIHRSSIIH
jgi:hypothetical protein